MAHTFLGKIFEKIHSFLLGTFGSEEKLEEYLLTKGDDAIAKAQWVRDALNSPVIDAAELAFPASFNAKAEDVRHKLEAKMDRIIVKLQKAQACLTLPTFAERLACFIRDVKENETKDGQDSKIFKFASLYTQASAAEEGKEVKTSMTDTVIQTKLYEKKIDLGTA